jgi:hypothetical protein
VERLGQQPTQRRRVVRAGGEQGAGLGAELGGRPDQLQLGALDRHGAEGSRQRTGFRSLSRPLPDRPTDQSVGLRWGALRPQRCVAAPPHPRLQRLALLQKGKTPPTQRSSNRGGSLILGAELPGFEDLGNGWGVPRECGAPVQYLASLQLADDNDRR